MTFEIPFDKNKSRAKFNVQLKLLFKKNIGKSVLNVLAAGVILLLVYISIRGNDSSGYFLL
jgi:hypothetical protein